MNNKVKIATITVLGSVIVALITLIGGVFTKKNGPENSGLPITINNYLQIPVPQNSTRPNEDKSGKDNIVITYPTSNQGGKEENVTTDQIRFCRNGAGTINGPLVAWVKSQKTNNSDLFCVTVQVAQGTYGKCYLHFNDCTEHRENPTDCRTTRAEKLASNHYTYYIDPLMVCFDLTQ